MGLDMYVVYNATPPLPYAIHAGDRERPLNKLTSTWCHQVHCRGPWEGDKQWEDATLAHYPLFLWYFPSFSNQKGVQEADG